MNKDEYIEKIEHSLNISNLYIKSLRAEMGKLKMEIEELKYMLSLEKEKNMKFSQMEKGELKQLRRDNKISRLESENKKLKSDLKFWQNKCISERFHQKNEDNLNFDI